MSTRPLPDGGPWPERIREARIARGISQQDLASELNISRQAVSQFETGVARPETAKFLQLADFLGFPENYFYSSPSIRLQNPVFFRSYKTAEHREKDMLRIRVGWMAEIFDYFRSFLEFPEFDTKMYTQETYSREKIVLIANETRKAWGIGFGPIENITWLLENHGCIISKVTLGGKKVDACSTIQADGERVRPLVCLSQDKSSAARSRFDAAHELGHLVLHSWADDDYWSNKENQKRMETEANAFAGAFLLPEESFFREVYSPTSIHSFVGLKRRWKVSIQMMIRRCYDAEYISKSTYEYLCRQISASRWRTREPLDDELVDERPGMLAQAVKLVSEGGVRTLGAIREELRLPVDEAEMLCGLEPGALREDIRPKLRLV